MKNQKPYAVDGPMCISFSGGRTSAFMLYQILQAHSGELPGDVKVCFANTGKEMPQTLDFVQRCSEEWSVEIIWLELDVVKLGKANGKRKKFEHTTKIVNYETAAKNGEPFEALVNSRSYLPNPVARFCTSDLNTQGIFSGTDH